MYTVFLLLEINRFYLKTYSVIKPANSNEQAKHPMHN